MRVINGEKLFTTLAHHSLGGEQIFGRGFVSDDWIRGDISRAIDCVCGAIASAADKATAFVGISFTRVRDDFIQVGLL